MRIYQLAAWRGGIVALALVCGAGGPVAAQWLEVPVPGTPRTADGKPNLKAPAPRTADGKLDLSGLWRVESYQWVNHLPPQGVQPPMLPWAAELYKQRAVDDESRDADDLLHAARRARRDAGQRAPLQDRPDAESDDSPLRGIS